MERIVLSANWAATTNEAQVTKKRPEPTCHTRNAAAGPSRTKMALLSCSFFSLPPSPCAQCDYHLILSGVVAVVVHAVMFIILNFFYVRHLQPKKVQVCQHSRAAYGLGARPHWARPKDVPMKPLMASGITAPCGLMSLVVAWSGLSRGSLKNPSFILFQCWRETDTSCFPFLKSGPSGKSFEIFPVITSAQCHLFLLHHKSRCRTVPRASLAAMAWLVRELGVPSTQDDVHPPHCEGLAMMASKSRRARPTPPVNIKAAVHLSTLSRAHCSKIGPLLCRGMRQYLTFCHDLHRGRV